MDIVLERILSLIPRKPNGEFAHGSMKEFAQSIGYHGGETINMWINGSSKSYKKKLHEIASVYNVSIAWLRGETDEKKPPAQGEELSERDIKLVKWFRSLPPEKQKAILVAQDGPTDAAD